MSLAISMVWECRSSGSDSNGGCWNPVAATTDYSQSDTAILSVSDAVTTGTTTVTSATGGFTAAMVGSGINIAGTVYEITARASTNSITVDRTTGTGTGQTAKVGGACASFGFLATNMVGNNKAYIKAGSGYSQTASSTFAQTVGADANNPPTRLTGYTTTRGDNGKATLALSTNTGLYGVHCTGQSWLVENIAVDCAGLGTSIGISIDQNYSVIRNCKATNFTIYGLRSETQSSEILACEATGGTAAATAAISQSSGRIIYCNAHDNACTGIDNGIVGTAIGNLSTNNTGATSDGIVTLYAGVIRNNTCHGNGRHGIFQNGTWASNYDWRDNILTNNGGYGVLASNGDPLPADSNYDGNAYYNNTSGARGSMDDTSRVYYSVNPYTNVHDVTLTGLPYTNAAGNDFSLNNTSGQGAACRGAGVPTSWPGASTTSHPDMGAVQSQSVTGGGMLVSVGMSGGIRG